VVKLAKIVFRVDGGPKIGIGHLIRCLALSEELVKKANDCYFLTNIDNDSILKNKIKYFNINYRKINSNDDLNDLLSFSKGKKIDWIITDNYCINSNYLKKIKKNGFKLLSIDDTAQIHYYSDIVVNQNIGADKLKFSFEKYSKILSGPKYVMLRNELLKRKEKNQNSDVRKILITFGGSDNDNFTLKILKVLNSINLKHKILIISGPFNPYNSILINYIKRSRVNSDLIISPEKMANIYLKSDIAISAGGSTCYELAYYGIPNIIITIADNQLNIARELHEHGLSLYLGRKEEVTTEQIKTNLIDLIDDSSLRVNMSKKGKKLIDGKGKKRIVDFIGNNY
jgi:UDP-2,4-diacetamido-2,4,6-trideoxy-beta-L-altropyranose hydrolase